MSRLRTALPLLLALLTATACTGGEEKGAPAKPPRLKKAWSVPFPGPPAQLPDTVWQAKGVLALPTDADGRNLVGLSASSGERRWQLPLPKGSEGLCALSERVNDKGIGGVLLKGEDGECSLAAAVDARKGRVLWTKPLSEPSQPSSDSPGVSVSERTLTATVSWREVVRFRLDGDEPGRKLPALPPLSKSVNAPIGADHDGRHIVLRTAHAFMLYDADKGTRLWQHRVPREGSHLTGGLLSADPVVLDAAEKGHRHYRAYGAGKLLGKELIRSGRDAPFTGRGVLVARFVNDPRVRAYDMRTGKEVWARTFSPFDLFVGVRGGALLSTHAFSGEETWLRSHDLRTAAPRTLGRLTGTASEADAMAWDSDRLYARVGTAEGAERLVAYTLPERGSTQEYQRPPEQTGAPPELGGHCEAVTDRSLRHLKLAPGRPTPETCEWREDHEPYGAQRSLKITFKESTDRAAAEEDFHDAGQITVNERGKARTLHGLGTEAKVYTQGTERAENAAQVVVRHGPLTFTVQAGTQTTSVDPSIRRSCPTPRGTERAALGAAKDVLRSLKDDPA
ncbi:PQQ-binding-like beta-propeller repeat protein [Streptomyces sp. NPDC048172]|uniref:outer membrane protein assembly factor BamB family protein n=1 Tax=Streptomyces sp. NPDC048172 TaxID=3365505 RepID=UPI003718D62C